MLVLMLLLLLLLLLRLLLFRRLLLACRSRLGRRTHSDYATGAKHLHEWVHWGPCLVLLLLLLGMSMNSCIFLLLIVLFRLLLLLLLILLVCLLLLLIRWNKELHEWGRRSCLSSWLTRLPEKPSQVAHYVVDHLREWISLIWLTLVILLLLILLLLLLLLAAWLFFCWLFWFLNHVDSFLIFFHYIKSKRKRKYHNLIISHHL